MSFVYESPDRGQTIYRRRIGEVVRELIKDSRTPDGRPLHDHIMEDKLWGDIRRAAKTNPALHDALERAIVIYQLSKKNDRQT
jgi:hypothetical protein